MNTLNLDPEAARRFLSALGYDLERPIGLELRLIGNGKQVLWPEPGHPAWPQVEAANKKGANVYFGVCPRRDRKGDATHTIHAPALWVDLDGKTYDPADPQHGKVLALERLRQALPAELQPSILVDSGNGYHVYWLLVEPWLFSENGDRLKCEATLKALAEYLGGDTGVADAARVMRLPGTLNVKDPDHPLPCLLLECNPEQRFNPSDFDANFTPAPVRQEPTPTPPLPTGERRKLARATVDFLALGAPEGERQQRAFKAACDLAGCGYTQAEALALVLDGARRCGLPEDEARHAVVSAYSKNRNPARPAEPPQDRENEATPVHLTDVDKAEMYGQRVAVPVTVVGVGECFAVPRQIEGVVCVAQNPNEPQCQACGLSRHYTVTLAADDPLVIASTAVDTTKLHKTLALELWHKARAGKLPHGKPACEKGHLAWGQVVHQPLTELMVYPLAHELHTTQDGDLVDEMGREYRRKDVFYLGEKSSNVQRFTAYGTVLANPKSQVVTLLIDRLEPLGEDLSFDPAQVHRLDVEDVEGLVEDWARCVTKVYGREDAHLALLLCYASPMYFRWEGELTKGWVEVAFCGDTTTGKGQSTLRTRAALGAGVYAVGESASRAGLLYGIEAGTRGHVLIWGELPQNDGRLLIVDGVNVIPAEEWEKFREARRTGVLLVRRIVSGDHPCRTRFVAIGNPKQAIASYKYPCLALCDLWGDCDIARFDVAVLFNEADVDVEIINMPPETGEDSSLEWLRHNVLRAWHVNCHDLAFTKEAQQAIYAQATRLARKYKAARRIPLLGLDAAKKIARLSLSLALLCGQTTANEQHVQYIADWLDNLYERAGLDRYATETQRKDKGGSDEEIAAALAWLQQRMAESDCLKWLVRDIFDQHASIRLTDIVAKAEGLWQEQNIRKRIAELRGRDLVTSSKRGYTRTQKFLAVLRQLSTASTASTASEVCPPFSENNTDAEKVGSQLESGTSGTSGTGPNAEIIEPYDPWDEEKPDG
jgi:hypothetical protein